jgi:hypothetical protein
MSGQFLNRSRWRPTHRQVRTERVPQHMRPASPQTRSACDPRERFPQGALRQRLPVLATQDAFTPQMPVHPQCLAQSVRHGQPFRLGV